MQPQYRFHGVKVAAQDTVLGAYGLTKEGAGPGILRTLFAHRPAGPEAALFSRQGLKNVGHGALDIVRDMFLGSPLSLADELKKHRAAGASWPAAFGRQARDWYMPGYSARPEEKGLGHYAGNALALWQPASALYDAVRAPDPVTRRGDLASAAAGVLASPFTGRFGLLGNIAQGALQQRARKLVQPATPYTPPYDPWQHARTSLRSQSAAIPSDLIPP